MAREGRAALTNSFQCFKFMALYSMIQFSTVTLILASGSDLSNYEYIYVDLILIFPLAITMSYSKSHDVLSVMTPSANLISFKVLFSVLGQILIQFVFQVNIFI